MKTTALGPSERFKVSDHESDHFFPKIMKYASHGLPILWISTKVGQVVEARWEDGPWYKATVEAEPG